MTTTNHLLRAGLAAVFLSLVATYSCPLFAQHGGAHSAYQFPRTSADPIPLLSISSMHVQHYCVGDEVQVPYILREIIPEPPADEHILEYRKVGDAAFQLGGGAEDLYKKFEFNHFVATFVPSEAGDYEVRVSAFLPGGTAVVSPIAIYTIHDTAFDASASRVTTVPNFSNGPVTISEFIDFLNWAMDPDADPGTDDAIVELPPHPSDGSIYRVRTANSFGPHEVIDLDDAQCPVTWNATDEQFESSGVGSPSDPVTEVSWYGAMLYAWAKNEREGHEQAIDRMGWTLLLDQKGYRLPTETEWQLAADSSGVSGAARQWCFDIYAKNTGLNALVLNPTGGAPFSVTKRVIRDPSASTVRSSSTPYATIEDVGFTLARTTADIYAPIADNDADGIPDDLDPDDDNDLLPDAYETLHGLDPLTADDGSEDHDYDGLATIIEFAIGQDHNLWEIPYPGFCIERGDSENHFNLTVHERAGLEDDGLDLNLQYSWNLEDWFDVDDYDLTVLGLTVESQVTSSETDSYGLVEQREFTLSSDPADPEPRIFFRLNVRSIPGSD